MNLALERREQADESPVTASVILTPLVDEDYWAYRVKLSDRQAVLGFPKFNTIGIGFAVEDASWNTNLSYTAPAEKIFDHIKRNKGDDSTAGSRSRWDGTA